MGRRPARDSGRRGAGRADRAGRRVRARRAPPEQRNTAVVAFNDRAAVGVIDRLERTGARVPAQISVAGFDDSLVARHARIDLTSVSQRLDQGRTERREIVLPTRLMVRGSTGSAAEPARAP
ncbi:MAG: substrate-binding domain-containing protein [Kineosporiaceae bacterium]